ncbi:putative aminotransferase-like, plant mobile domain-containing protein [Helianthus annuus]|nr:putative aminotransferase-like, plant mobile domain-containing protein [Helianthus annuus]
MILGGFSVVGDSVNDGSVALIPDLAGKVEKMNRFRSELVRSKSKKASHSKWMQMFMKKTNEQEHVGFLALWLSRFGFPSGDQDSVGKHVIPIAVRLSQGVKLALAPAVLAYIYHNLTKLKEQCVDSSYSNLKSSSCVNLLGPFQLVQIWVYERFPVVGQKGPNELRPSEPRLTRWHVLNSNVSLLLLRSHMISLESFIWRPYAVDLQNWKQPLHYQDSEQIISDSLVLDDDLQFFYLFIAPCELVNSDILDIDSVILATRYFSNIPFWLHVP